MSRNLTAEKTKQAQDHLIQSVKDFRAEDGVEQALERVRRELVNYITTSYGDRPLDELVPEVNNPNDPASQNALAEIQLNYDAHGRRKAQFSRAITELLGIGTVEPDWHASRNYLDPLKAEVTIFRAALASVAPDSAIVRDLATIDAAAKQHGLYSAIDKFLRDTPAKKTTEVGG